MSLGIVLLLALVCTEKLKKGLLLGGAVVLLIVVPIIVFSVAALGYFEFGDGVKATSTSVRLTKTVRALQTFRENPFFGIGYGSVGVLDSKTDGDIIHWQDSRFFENVTDKRASAESTPFQILAETGLLGGLVSLWLTTFAGLRWWRCVGSARVPGFVKFALLGWAVVFLIGFIGSNGFGTLIFMLAVPVAAFQAYCKAPASVPRIMGAQRLSSSAAIRAAKS